MQKVWDNFIKTCYEENFGAMKVKDMINGLKSFFGVEEEVKGLTIEEAYKPIKERERNEIRKNFLIDGTYNIVMNKIKELQAENKEYVKQINDLQKKLNEERQEVEKYKGFNKILEKDVGEQNGFYWRIHGFFKRHPNGKMRISLQNGEYKIDEMEMNNGGVFCRIKEKLPNGQLKDVGIPEVKKIITENPPYTTILFTDGTKQVVKASGKEVEQKIIIKDSGLSKDYKITTIDGYNRDKGIMIALLERIYGKKKFYEIMEWKDKKNE